MLVYNGNTTEGVYTLSEFISELDGPAVCKDNADALKSHLDRKNKDWMGLGDEAKEDETDFQATTRLVRDGWRKGVDLMEEVSKDIVLPAPRTIRRVQRWMDRGDELDMQSVWNGNIERAWRGTTRDYRSGPQRIRILIDAIESGGMDAKSMRWKGVAALKLADALTEAGYSVQIESVIHCPCSSKDSRKFKCRIIVKEYTAPADLLTLAATTALPAFFRSLIHQWGLKVANYHRSWGVSFNVVTKLTPDMFKDEGDTAPAFVLPRTIRDAEKASEAIQDILKQIEGEGE
jgi:hypothetical protein